MKFIKSKKGLALLATLAVAVVAAVGAYAYFTNSGHTDGTPVAVGDQTPDFAVALNSDLSGTGGSLNSASTTYSNGNSKLLPTAVGDDNADVATVPFTITNGSEANEVLNTYTVSIENPNASAWFSCGTGGGTITACTNGLPACTASDFSIDGLGVGLPSTVTVAGAPDTLSPASDAPANSRAYTFSVQLVDNNDNQDNCENVSPAIHVSATS